MFKAIFKTLALTGLLFSTTSNAASQTKDDIAMEEAVAAYNSGNLKKAEKIWLELANSEAPAVQHNLGILYERDGDPTNDTQAAEWYELAIDQGYLPSNVNLGLMYFYGTLPTDYEKSYQLLLPAAEYGFHGAQETIGIQFLMGLGMATDYVSALSWLTAAAEGGFPSAMGYLGYMYQDGLGTEKDIAKAIEWSRPAAEAGYAMFQHNLAVILEEEEWNEFYDPQQAAYWYSKAVEQQYPSAMLNLGVMYMDGIGVTQDYKTALMWFTIATKFGLNDLAEINIENSLNQLGVSNEEEFNQVYAQVMEMVQKCENKNYSKCNF